MVKDKGLGRPSTQAAWFSINAFDILYRSDGKYEDGQMVDLWTTYHENGKLRFSFIGINIALKVPIKMKEEMVYGSSTVNLVNYSIT